MHETSYFSFTRQFTPTSFFRMLILLIILSFLWIISTITLPYVGHGIINGTNLLNYFSRSIAGFNEVSKMVIASHDNYTNETFVDVQNTTSWRASHTFQVSLNVCPVTPQQLQGKIPVDTSTPTSFRELEVTLIMVRPGGHHRPQRCRTDQKLAVVIPYRDRNIHLRIFLRHIHPFLQKQQLDYAIFVIEMQNGVEFNRAFLFNVGYVEATKMSNFTCFIFHDVDLLPENDHNLYRCSKSPRHLSVAIDKLKYRLPYTTIFGGVSALTAEQFVKVNGFSNKYFGWGGEDDDMFKRLHSNGYKIDRRTPTVARYKSLHHSRSNKPNIARFKLLRDSVARMSTDGINSLNYTLVVKQEFPLYTWILVHIDRKAYTC